MIDNNIEPVGVPVEEPTPVQPVQTDQPSRQEKAIAVLDSAMKQEDSLDKPDQKVESKEKEKEKPSKVSLSWQKVAQEEKRVRQERQKLKEEAELHRQKIETANKYESAYNLLKTGKVSEVVKAFTDLGYTKEEISSLYTTLTNGFLNDWQEQPLSETEQLKREIKTLQEFRESEIQEKNKLIQKQQAAEQEKIDNQAVETFSSVYREQIKDENQYPLSNLDLDYSTKLAAHIVHSFQKETNQILTAEQLARYVEEALKEDAEQVLERAQKVQRFINPTSQQDNIAQSRTNRPTVVPNNSMAAKVAHSNLGDLPDLDERRRRAMQML